MDIFSERNKKLIAENYENFFAFDTQDMFFKENLIEVMLDFNITRCTGKINGVYYETSLIGRILFDLTRDNRYFYENKDYIIKNYYDVRIILLLLSWEYLFDVIESQYNGFSLSNQREKKMFLEKINSFLKKNEIPWFLQEEKGEINKINKLIKRDYFYYLTGSKDNKFIKFITGVRRSGKSKLLETFRDYLLETKTNNVIFIDLELKKNEELLDSNKLYDYINKQFKNGIGNYLIIDEVHKCHNFERIMSSFNKEGKFDIYLTGSNAFALKNILIGRHIELKIYPFSFKEFNTYFNYSNPIKINSFDKYIKKGGMSISYNVLENKEYINEINKIYKGILEDITEEKKLEKNEKLLIDKIACYLMDNIGEKTSIENIANSLKINDVKTVESYINDLCESFLFYPFPGYDVKGKELLNSNKKYYLVDVSFRFANIGTKDMDYGKIYENIVAIELLRRGYEVYVGVLKEKEIDFVAIKNGCKNYIQVSCSISNPKTFEREVSPLLSIKDAYPKILIARTEQPEYQHEGIKIFDISEWLNNN